MLKLPPAEVLFGADGTPRSNVSDDVYFSVDGGIDESRHVFLAGIGAPDCWRERTRFRVGELGFGTGLNFLVTWAMWAETAPQGASLDFISIEGRPLSKDELSRALSPLSQELPRGTDLVDAYPPRLAGVHRIAFDGGRVRLTLLFGYVAETLNQMSGLVDAWYLDGFSPAKNPEMWSEEILSQVTTRLRPGGRVATFTAAGVVRRALSDLGFDVVKRPGFGRKRDCVQAVKAGTFEGWYPKQVAVIGGGVAGATVARALTNRGMAPTVFDPGVGQGASGNPVALLAPRLPRERTKLGQVLAASYLFAVPYYDALAREAGGIWHGKRGAFALARNDDEEDRQQKALKSFELPENVMRRVEPSEATALIGMSIDRPGLWFAGAGSLNPIGIVAALLSAITVIGEPIEKIEVLAHAVCLSTPSDKKKFDAVVLTTGADVPRLLQGCDWPMRPNRGQLAYLRATQGAPNAPITFGGYLCPNVPTEWGRAHILGATYGRRDEMPEADWSQRRPEDDEKMIANLGENLPGFHISDTVGGRTAVRATVRDYLPIAGAVAPHVFTLTGLGSRGFLTSPLLAEMVADTIVGASPPLPRSLVEAVSPKRFG